MENNTELETTNQDTNKNEFWAENDTVLDTANTSENNEIITENQSAVNVKKKDSFFTTRKLAIMGIMSALAFVLTWVRFPLPFMFPAFLEFQISELPALFVGFLLGPIHGGIVVIIKSLLDLATMRGTGTMFIGNLSNLIVDLAFVLSASVIYHIMIKRFKLKNKSLKATNAITAIVSLSAGVLVGTGIAILANWLIVIPLFVRVMFEGSWMPLLGMTSVLYPNITVETFYRYYLSAAVLPFNILRLSISAVIAFFTYKVLKPYTLSKKKKTEKTE